MPWNVSQNALAIMSNVFHFPYKDDWNSFTYLGMPIFLHSATSNLWQQILNKIKSKFVQWGAHWLNPTRRITLIKAVLSSLPIYQCSSLLAPIGVQQQIEKEIQKFLWQGGKSNNKRFHLISWSIVRAPKMHGGLGILDPRLMNLALGGKILWRIVTRKYDWWKKVLVKKYFTGPRKRCLDELPTARNGSPIWKLINAVVPIIQSDLTWVPGNGGSIDIWHDNIMGNKPLVHIQELGSFEVLAGFPWN
jgi:hypothetical protein